MRKLSRLQITASLLVALFVGGALAWASGATNFTRIVLGSSNYASDPAPTADIVLQNDEYISNSSDGTINFGAANLTTTGNVSGATLVHSSNAGLVSLAVGTPTRTPAAGSVDMQGSLYARGNVEAVNANAVALAVGTPTRTPAAGIVDLQGDLYSRGNIYAAAGLVACTTDTTVLASKSGAVYTNAGSAGNVILTLPTAAAGLVFTFSDVNATAARDLTIQAATGDKINGGTAGKKYECTTDAVKQSTTILAIDATDWVVIHEVGTWANNNT